MNHRTTIRLDLPRMVVFIILKERITMEVPYRQSYEKYEIAVIPVGDDGFDVRFMIKGQEASYSIEVCKSEHHAVEGAKQFPQFYEMAMQHGYRINPLEFVHPDGRTVDLTCAMDLDRTEASFEQLLISGEKVIELQNE